MLVYFIFLSLFHLIASYTVIPDDCYYNTIYHGHNLDHYLQNNTKYFTHNTQLLFLPGVHCLHTDLVIENVYNISLNGRSNDSSNTTSAIIQCNSTVGIIIKNVTNLSVKNMVVKNCLASSFSAAVIIKECSNVKLHHVQIYHTHYYSKYENCLKGFNLVGNSHLDYISCDKQIYFDYFETNTSLDNQVISLNHYNIVDNFTNSYYTSAIYIELNQFSYSITFCISNTNTRKFQERLIIVQAQHIFKFSTIVMINCKLQGNDNNHKTNQFFLYLLNVNVYFNNCQFVSHNHESLILTYGSKFLVFSYCIFHHNRLTYGLIGSSHRSNVTIEHCKFYKNVASIFTLVYEGEDPSLNCKQTKTIIIKNTTFFEYRLSHASLMRVACARLLLIGPVKFYSITIALVEYSLLMYKLNNAYVPIEMFRSIITVDGYIEFSQNTVGSLIKYAKCETQECFFMNVADNATLMITNNTLITYFYAYAVWENQYQAKEMKYPPCFFQYLNSSTTNSKIKSMNYSIIFDRNVDGIFGLIMFKFNEMLYTQYYIQFPYSFQLKLPITHCYWLPHSAFTATIPLDVNREYVTFTNNSEHLPQSSIQKLLCYCINDTQYDCYKDDLGYVYPGQTVTVPLCYTGNLTSTKVLVDTNFNRTHFTPCVVHKPEEFIQFTSKKCTQLQYTIAFVTDNWCELFLKIPFSRHVDYSIFYVRQCLCPLGFNKKDGICQCHPSFKLFDIKDCNINNQTILRPGNSWIYATNHDNYYISLYCPFYYCMQYSFYLNLTTPELQCQFNRSGLLCGQCQQGLSTVLGSPDCQHCSSVYLLLIIPIAMAGILLVLILFLLNLTVTDGTINAFIFYANIISINSTTFFPDYNSSQNTFQYVFISLANLDLGIKTCFYDGMDDYAKMWLQLAFPFYLIFIAVLLILASRYSAMIQKITAHRALPVLATLFLLSYTKILRIVSISLFFYSSITHLPSEHSTLVWSVDANVTLFGMRFTLLFVVCLILFLAMVPFNVILLFTKTVSRFSIVTKFKPLLDAYQGPYKIKFYYWTGLQLILRIVFFSSSSLDRNINLTIGIIILSIVNIAHAYCKPFKSKIKNYQESLFILNLLGLSIFTASFVQNEISYVFVNILIIMAMDQFTLIVMYHILEYTCNKKIKERAVLLLHTSLSMVRGWVSRWYKRPITTGSNQQFQLHDYNIPEVTYNYHEYQEPLIGQEYCK